jgi:hypothetical protein
MARLCPTFKRRAALRRVPDLLDAAQDEIHTRALLDGVVSAIIEGVPVPVPVRS